MTPYVIDNRKQLTIYLLFILGIIGSFILGCVFGYQMANTELMIAPAAVVEQTIEPVTDESMEGDKVIEDTKKSDNRTPIEQKKNDKQENSKKAQQEKKNAKNTTQNTKQIKQASIKKVEPVIKKPVVSPAKKITDVKPPVSVTKPVQTSIKKDTSTAPLTSQKTDAQPASVSTNNNNSDSSAEILRPQSEETKSSGNTDGSVSTQKKKSYYSVQAGLFANRDNAVKFLDELLSNGFDAYLVDFVSSSGVVKYNVRFGRSEDRNTSRQRLVEFRQAFTTPAYIVIGN
ncbi:MAG: SPOR domain-containing protein [Gammaproteobacteria bacterium]|nr:SPOR domain-containing protein [Gammaproteobacteria bacterium]